MTPVGDFAKPAITEKVALLEPGAMVTVGGTLATELLLASARTAPFGADMFRNAVAVEALPLPTVAGFRFREDIQTGLEVPCSTVTKALLRMLPPRPSSMRAAAMAATPST